MVVRQDYANEEFMTGYLNFIDRFRPKALKKIESLTDSTHRKRLTRNVFYDGLKGIIACYTLGFDIDVMAQRFDALLEDMRRLFAEELTLANDGILEQYINCLWLISFCYFFDAPKSDVQAIADRNPFTGKDQLIDRLLITAKNENLPLSDHLVYPKVYQPLVDLLPLTLSKEDRDKAINSFLDGYLNSLKGYDVTWLGSHKEREATYYRHVGYWQFELAALVTDIGWDDSAFREHTLYPADLVDWKRSTIADR